MHDIFNATPDIQILAHLDVWDIFEFCKSNGLCS